MRAGDSRARRPPALRPGSCSSGTRRSRRRASGTRFCGGPARCGRYGPCVSPGTTDRRPDDVRRGRRPGAHRRLGGPGPRSARLRRSTGGTNPRARPRHPDVRDSRGGSGECRHHPDGGADGGDSQSPAGHRGTGARRDPDRYGVAQGHDRPGRGDAPAPSALRGGSSDGRIQRRRRRGGHAGALPGAVPGS